jgi:8-oxo-(d)GTP phosphatase
VTVEQAAGVLCWRQGRDGLEVLLVHRPRYDDWSWPKGKVKDGEPLPCTAIREAAEETGLDVVLGRPVGDVRYPLESGRRKHVTYWAATVVGPATDDRDAQDDRSGDRSDDTGGEPGADGGTPTPPEIDEVTWLPLREAEARLSRKSDADPLRALERSASAGALATAPVLVVRHGTSRPRDSWPQADADRPLISAGRRQANGLVPLLACWRPERVLSSPWKRCLDTVEPYATAAGLAVRTKGSLSEEGAHRSPGRTRRNIHRLLDRGRPALLCTHRPVLAEVFGVVRAACLPGAADGVPDSNPFLAPGEVLVAHVAVGTWPARVVAVERHRPRS